MITEVAGMLVGHAERRTDGWLTGVTVVIPPSGTVGAVDVRGGGPATHETDALAAGTLVDTVDAVVLCGGSAFGLAAVHGVQRWCEEEGRGFVVGEDPAGAVRVVPIVAAAALFDLGRGGDWCARPDADLGYQAALAASTDPPSRGSVGAGTGARSNAGQSPGGVGMAGVHLDGGLIVAALVVVNAAGRVLAPDDLPLPPRPSSSGPPLNTTLAVVATNARLDVATAHRLAGAGHDGLARAIEPIHTMVDGDTVFALATGEIDLAAGGPVTGWPGAARAERVAALQVAAATACREAVLDAWRCSQPGQS